MQHAERRFFTMILVHSNKIASLFNEAEVALKQYERINLLNLLPAVNELRYAGRHLLEAENAISEEEREKHEAQAIDHCERAKWDAKEATIISLLDFIAELRSRDISPDDMRMYIPEWDKFIDDASKARSLLERAGIHDSVNAPDVDDAIEKLLDFRDRIIEAEPKVLSLLEQRKKKAYEIEEYNLAEKARVENEKNIERERQDDRRYVTSMILSLMGIVLGFLGVAASIFGILITIKSN